MATYTSTQAGLWNDPATWGGGGYPQLTNDIFNIGHLVTLNIQFDPATVAFGQGNINNNGILTFARDKSTRLVFAHQDLMINSGGWLKVGESGLIIPKQYLAELVWKTTGENTKGINIANGGKLSIYGDPDYFGSVDKTTLVSEAVIPTAGNSVTLTVTGDFTTKWVAGQELLVHKGGAYASYINDFCRLAITSVAANGSNSDVACTVTQRPAALTCLVGADVLNLSRNVMLYKYAYIADLGQFNANRPRITNANATGTVNVNMSDVSIAGFASAIDGNNVFFNGVVRNGLKLCSSLYLSTVNGIICICSDGSISLNNCVVNAWVAAVQSVACKTFESTVINGNILGAAGSGITGVNNTINGHIYSNNTGMDINDGVIVKGNIGYDGVGVQKSNTTDFNLLRGRYLTTLINSLTKSVPVFTRNTLTYNSRIRFEHFLQVVGDHYVADAFGDIYNVAADGSGDNPNQRSGGGAKVLEVVPQTNCAANALLELFNMRLWATAGVSKTYRFYIQSTYDTLPAAELKLYGEYLDAGSGGHLATVASTQDITARADAADWSQYVEVTIPAPAQNGYVNLYLWLMGYEANKKVWVDPKVAITGGDAVTVTPRWSYGEVQLDINPVCRVSPSNLGLVPLGIKQVAI